MAPPESSEDAQARQNAASARLQIEDAIAVLTTHQAHLGEGQIKAIKRLIYGVPKPETEPDS